MQDPSSKRLQSRGDLKPPEFYFPAPFSSPRPKSGSQPRSPATPPPQPVRPRPSDPGRSPRLSLLTCHRRGEAEGVVAVALPVAGSVATDTRPTVTAARSACVEYRVAHGALEQPARVTPVQSLGPRWREMGVRGVCRKEPGPKVASAPVTAWRGPWRCRGSAAHPRTAGRRWPGVRPAPRTPASPRSN